MADAVNELETRMQAKRLPLSVCYRCPTTVVNAARTLVPQIEACDTASEGAIEQIPLARFRQVIQEGDLVLCRCVKPLVAECLGLIRAGHRAKVKGREIGDQLKGLVQKLASGPQQPISDFNIALEDYLITQTNRLAAINREAQQIQLLDTVDTIKVLAESCDVVSDILLKIDSIFTDRDEGGIQLMSVHKSKGLQNRNVFILEPSLMPHPRATKPEDVKVEMNLKYVAITRSQERLYWVQ
jgi:hypothetical protein